MVNLVADVDPRTASSMLDDYDPRYGGQIVVGRDNVGIIAGGFLQVRQEYDQPWRSDGTSEGTYRLADVRIDRKAIQDRLVAGPDGTVFFGGSTPELGHELWKTDGTVAGTMLVKDIFPGPGSSLANPFPVAVFAGPDGRSRAVFSAADAQFIQRLWVSDGTEAGTVSFANNPVVWPANPGAVGSGSQAFFIANDFSTGFELWRTDGTAAGTRLVKDINPGTSSTTITNMTPAPGGLLYFRASDGAGTAVWRTDGTDSGTYAVARPSDNRLFYDQRFGVDGDAVYFFMDKGLWKTRGGPMDATEVADFEFGEGTGTIAAAGGAVYFFVDGGSRGLWKSDGTPAGTARVVGPDDLYLAGVNELAAFGGRAYFRAARPGQFTDIELWGTDGTAAGTRRVKDIAPGEHFSSDPFLFAPAGDHMFFAANDLTSRFEPWVTDGTEAGTRLLRDLSQSPYGFGPIRLTRSGDKVFFFTPSMPHGGLWATDGTTGGTRLVRADIFPARTEVAAPNLVADVNGMFFFAAAGFDEQPGLWKSDGTPDGTVRIAGVSNPSHLTPAGNRLFFTATDLTGSLNHVWVVDRDGGSPRPLAATPSAIVRPEVLRMTPVGDVVYFPAITNNGAELLWRSDGTPAGTYPMLTGDSDPWQPRAITDLDGTLMFLAHNAAGVGLYRSGGTAETTSLVEQVVDRFAGLDQWYNSVVSNGVMFFGAPYGGVWRSDGTPEGTFLIKDTGTFGTDWVPAGSAVARDGRVYFTSWESTFNSIALWASDGSREGTRKLFEPRIASSPPQQLTPSSDGGVYFNAALSGNGYATTLWHSDGTPEGTQPLGWDSPEAPGVPTDLVALGDDVLFAGTDPAVGRELFKAGPAPLQIVGRHVFYNGSAFDGGDPGAGTSDDAAVATDKVPLLPGQGGGTFANITSYPRGINGVMIDFAGSPPLTALAGLAGAATVKTGPGGDPATWAAAPAPSQIAIRPGAGVNGSTRVTLIWPDGAIKNTWLEVSIPAIPQAGLAEPDVFYFGNLVGENGDAGGVGAPRRVNALDLAAVKQKLNRPAPIDDPADVNRDGRVNALDLGLVKANLNRSLAELVVPIPAAAIIPAQPSDRPPAPAGLWDEQPADLLA